MPTNILAATGVIVYSKHNNCPLKDHIYDGNIDFWDYVNVLWGSEPGCMHCVVLFWAVGKHTFGICSGLLQPEPHQSSLGGVISAAYLPVFSNLLSLLSASSDLHLATRQMQKSASSGGRGAAEDNMTSRCRRPCHPFPFTSQRCLLSSAALAQRILSHSPSPLRSSSLAHTESLSICYLVQPKSEDASAGASYLPV